MVRLPDGSRMIIFAPVPPVKVRVVLMVCVPVVEKYSFEAAVVSVNVLQVNASANVTPPADALVIWIVLNALPAEVIDCAAPPFNMTVDPVAVSVAPVKSMSEVTVHVPDPVVSAAAPVKSMSPAIETVGSAASPVTSRSPLDSVIRNDPEYVCVPAPSMALWLDPDAL